MRFIKLILDDDEFKYLERLKHKLEESEQDKYTWEKFILARIKK